MKSLLAFSAVLSVAAAVLEMSIAKHPKSPMLSSRSRRRSLEERQTPIQESVLNIRPWTDGGSFYMNVSVGTPGQVMTVNLNTWSSVTYFDAQNSSECIPAYQDDAYGNRLCAGGSFQTNFSSTYRIDVADGLNFTLDSGPIATGDLAIDIIQIGKVELANARFGVASHNLAETGIIGLGYGLNDGTVTASPRRSFLEELQAAGAINSKLYSLLLNSSSSPTGSIVFGGIDYAHFTGELVSIDFLPSGTDWRYDENLNGHTVIDAVTQPLVAITDIGVTYPNGTTAVVYENGDPSGHANGSLPSILDVGTVWWSVSPDVYDTITPMILGLNGTTGVVPCETDNEDIHFSVSFANLTTIDIPLADLVIPVFDGLTGVQNTTSEGQPLCYLALYPYNGSLSYSYTVGSSVMRSMYLVFDLDNAQVSIAQAATASCDDYDCQYIVDVPAGSDGLAQALAGVAQEGRPSITVVTATPNAGLVEALITATGMPNSITPVARTTTLDVGTVVGSEAIPSGGEAIPETVLSSGSLGSATHTTPSITSATTAASGTASQKAAACRLGQSEWASSISPLPGVLCIALTLLALTMIL